MLTGFESVSEESRVYYYPASRKFYPDEVPELKQKISEFCQGLEGVQIAYQFLYDRFIVFFVSDATPLSLEQNDLLVEFVMSLEKDYDLILLDKVNVCFKQGKFVQRKEIGEFKKMIKNRSVSAKTVVFDPMTNNKSEFLTNWEVPLSRSWLGYLL
jgi:hypothetical protein